jgi:hypothetical protein
VSLSDLIMAQLRSKRPHAHPKAQGLAEVSF